MSRIPFRPPSQLWFATAFMLLAVVVYLSISHETVQIPGDDGGRYGHLAAYSALMFMYARMYATARWRFVIGVTLVMVGATLEVVQAGTGYRTFEVGDIVADAVGVVLGGLAARTFSRMTAMREMA